jgi:hypothetical protein
MKTRPRNEVIPIKLDRHFPVSKCSIPAGNLLTELFQSTKICKRQDRRLRFRGSILGIVFDAHSPISLTGIDKIKRLSIICIHVIFLIFIIH